MPELLFDPATHTYSLGGEILDSVTTILKEEGYIDGRWYKEGSADKGTLIHEATAAIDNGDLSLSDFKGDDIFPYLEAWELFKIDNDFKPEHIEKLVYEPDLEYAGTLDRIGTWKQDEKIIIDIKSGGHELWHGLQLAAYRRTQNHKHMVRRVVHLKDSGKYSISYQDKKIGHYDDPAWDQIWATICMARIYRKRYAKR